MLPLVAVLAPCALVTFCNSFGGLGLAGDIGEMAKSFYESIMEANTADVLQTPDVLQTASVMQTQTKEAEIQQQQLSPAGSTVGVTNTVDVLQTASAMQTQTKEAGVQQASPTDAPTATTVPKISVTTDTNCRKGTNVIYDYLGAFLIGDGKVPIVAKDPTGRYWYINNPDAPGGCWVSGNYAVVEGDTSALPVFTPPPPPTLTPTPTPTSTSTSQPSHTPTITYTPTVTNTPTP